MDTLTGSWLRLHVYQSPSFNQGPLYWHPASVEERTGHRQCRKYDIYTCECNMLKYHQPRLTPYIRHSKLDIPQGHAYFDDTVSLGGRFSRSSFEGRLLAGLAPNCKTFPFALDFSPENGDSGEQDHTCCIVSSCELVISQYKVSSINQWD